MGVLAGEVLYHLGGHSFLNSSVVHFEPMDK